MLIKLHKVKSSTGNEETIDCLLNPDYIINVFPVEKVNTIANSFIQVKDRESWNPFYVLEDMETIMNMVNNHNN